MNPQFGSVADVAAATGYAYSTIRRKAADPADDFPAPRRFTARCVRWEMDAVLNWMKSRPLVTEKEKGAAR